MTATGPLFDGRAEAAASAGTEAVRTALAAQAQSLVLSIFLSQIRNGTGAFARSVTQARTSRSYTTHSGRKSYTLPVVVPDIATDIAVTTDLATYGPWLEGTGSRNASTRFKGYHGFRQAAQEVDRTAQLTASTVFSPFTGAMN